MKGRITYTTTMASTPVQSPLTVADIFSLQNVFSETLGIGQMQDIYLYWGYKSQDPYHNDKRNVSQSAAGVVEITNFGSTQGFKFTLSNIILDRTAQVNEYAIINALNDEVMNGTVIKWYPDHDNFPTEYYSCVANKRLDPKRIGIRNLFEFTFDLMVLASVQIPSTVPPFVLS